MQEAINVGALPRVPNARVAILRSKWYPQIVGALHEQCVATLAAKGVDDVDTHLLPGCFEFPFAANEIMATHHSPNVLANISPEAIICLGVVLKGDTHHFEMIVDECVRGLGAVSRRHRVPIVNEVLPVTDIAQAEARAGDDEFNKGIEAAAAAIEIIHWRRELEVEAQRQKQVQAVKLRESIQRPRSP